MQVAATNTRVALQPESQTDLCVLSRLHDLLKDAGRPVWYSSELAPFESLDDDLAQEAPNLPAEAINEPGGYALLVADNCGQWRVPAGGRR